MKQTTPRKTLTAKSRGRTNFSFRSSSTYADNAEYADKAIPFDILAIAFESGRGFEGGDRWAVTAKAEGREIEMLTLGANPKRDEQMREAQAHLKRGGSIKNIRLRRSGNAYYFTDKGA